MWSMLMSDEDVMRWGRWSSMAYKLYVHVHDDVMKQACIAAAKLAPKYELN